MLPSQAEAAETGAAPANRRPRAGRREAAPSSAPDGARDASQTALSADDAMTSFRPTAPAQSDAPS